MAKILGGITTSHVPAIGRAIAQNLQHDPYWKPLFDGFTAEAGFRCSHARAASHLTSELVDALGLEGLGSSGQFRRLDGQNDLMRHDDTIVGMEGNIAPMLRLISAKRKHLLGPHHRTVLLARSLPQQLLQVQKASADDRAIRGDYRILVDVQH